MKKGLFVFTLIFSFVFFATAQRGKDGAKVVAGTEVVNAYTSLTIDANAGNTSITVANVNLNTNFSGVLAPGDLIMIIQVQGVSVEDTIGTTGSSPLDSSSQFFSTWGRITNYNNCGNYEFVQVESIPVPGGTIINLDCPLSNNYTASGNVVVVRVPRYSSLIVPGGTTLSCDPWNGSVGGVLAIEVDGLTTIDGTVDVSTIGFRGGQFELLTTFGGSRYAANNGVEGGEKGEGIAGDQVFYDAFITGRFARGAAANAGGGGNAHNAGGGGGSNAGNPLNWNTGAGVPDPIYNLAWALETPSLVGLNSSGGGRGGYSHSGSANGDELSQGPGDPVWSGDGRREVGGLGGRPLDYSTGRIFMGGAGGAGDGEDLTDGATPGSGGNGGGIIFFSTYGDVGGSGTVVSNGQDGFNCEGIGTAPFNTITGKDAAGGGGAGGTILIQTTGIVSGITINANGGAGGNQVLKQGTFATIGEVEGPGGGGGGGYIAITSGAPTRTTNGGIYGTTNSPFVNNSPTPPNNFAANGATSGGLGMPTETISAFDVLVSNDTICIGTASTLTGSIIGTAPGGAVFEWYDSPIGGTLLFTGNPFVTPVLAANTTYYLRVCPAPYRVPVTVFINPCATITANFSSTDSTLCVGDCIDFTDLSFGTPATGWTWSFPGAATSSSTAQNPTNICYNTAGSFDVQLIVTDGTNIDTLLVTNFITVNALPTVIAGPDTSICLGDTANIYATGATTYSWDNGLGLGQNFAVNPVINTTYIVTGTDGNGCVNTDSTIVSINALPTVIAGPDTSICLGDTANIYATGATTYSWDNGLGIGQNFAVNPIVNTTYTVTGTDANGCVNTDNTIVSINALPTVIASVDTTICSGDVANLSATGATSYFWNNGLGAGQNQTPSPISTTTYTVTGTDPNGCMNTDSVIVTVNPCGNPPVSSFSATDSSICIGDCIDFNDLSTGIPTGWTWYFFGSATPTSNVQNPTTICYNTAGSFDVALVTVNAFGQDSLFIANFITVNPLPTVIASADTTICSGDVANLSGTGALTYNWDNSLGAGQNQTPSPLVTTTYIVTGTDANGCVNTDSVVVTVSACGNPPVASFSSSDSTLCVGDCIDFTDLSTGIPTGWTWYFFGATTPTSNAQNPTSICYNTAGIFDVALVASNANGQDSIFIAGFITVNALPAVIASNDTTICSGDTVNISASGALTYTWNNGLGAGQNQSPTPLTTTTYMVTGTDANGCTNSDSLLVTVNICAPPAANFNASLTNLCINDCVDFNDISTGGTPTAWNWYFFGANPTTSNVQNPTNICYDSTGTFDVALMVSNVFGQDSIFVSSYITVDSCLTTPVSFTIPNIFSPNGDGQNDLFIVDGTGIISLTMNVYNRWGSLMHSSNQVGQGWDGRTTAGAICSEGTYFYIIELETTDATETYKGTLTLIR